jgi:hypothetical protein
MGGHIGRGPPHHSHESARGSRGMMKEYQCVLVRCSTPEYLPSSTTANGTGGVVAGDVGLPFGPFFLRGRPAGCSRQLESAGFEGYTEGCGEVLPTGWMPLLLEVLPSQRATLIYGVAGFLPTLACALASVLDSVPGIGVFLSFARCVRVAPSLCRHSADTSYQPDRDPGYSETERMHRVLPREQSSR